MVSDASLVAPYNETGGATEKASDKPSRPAPGGSTAETSRANASSFGCTGKDASAGMEYTRLLLRSTSPAVWRRQYSSVFTVLQRLCSRSCRLLTRPSTPARTLGVA